MKNEKGIVSKAEFAEIIAEFLVAESWKASPEPIALQELHQHFLNWLIKNSVVFSVPQRLFCMALIERGFRAAYMNIKVGDEWRFRKVIFAIQESAS